MKRNMDLCREILLFYESDCATARPETDSESWHQHMVWLIEAGFIAGKLSDSAPTGTPRPFRSMDGRIIETDTVGFERFPLTWAGCEFLDSIRDDSRWGEVKTVADKAKDWAFSTISQIATAIATQEWQNALS